MERLLAYWWNTRSNFGDALTPLLLEAFSGVRAEYAEPEDAQIVVVGSILEHLPTRWDGTVVGAGRMYEDSDVDLSAATVLALRGALSAKGIAGQYVLGDPGLLADELVPMTSQYELGVVPHWSDLQLADRFKQYHPRVIHPSMDPLDVIREIGSCRKIVASSLHGIIVADAFGIPRRAEMFAGAKREGGDFKFRDYASAIGVPMAFGKLQCPPRWRIEHIQRDLFDVFQTLRG